MPFERSQNVHEEDPELLAEREFERLSTGSGGSGKAKSAKKCAASNGFMAALAADADSLGDNSLDGKGKEDPVNGVVSTGSTGSLASKNSFKETKADRKKRSRGVSGSSIKKDGGRFDLGMENLDAYDDVSDAENNTYDDYARYVSDSVLELGDTSSDYSNDAPLAESPSEVDIDRVRDGLLRAMSDVRSDQFVGLLADVLTDHFDDNARFVALERAMDDLLEKSDWEKTESVDRMWDYKMVCIVAKLIDQGLIDKNAFRQFVDRSSETLTIQIMLSAIKFVEENSPEVKGSILSEPPQEFTEMAKELALTGDASRVSEALIGCPFFHADMIHQAATEAVTSMNMDIIYYAVKAFKQLVHDQVMTVTAVNGGVSRFLSELADLEMDLPAAKSLAHLLVSYAIDSPAIINNSVYLKCPKPKTLLRKRVNSMGRLSICESQGDVNETNYLEVE